MKKLSFLIVFLILSPGIKSQSIIAGQHGIKDYFKDFEPDSTIWCLSGQGCSYSEIPIDLNADTIPDITFITRNSAGAMGGGNDYLNIKATNNNRIASGSSGSCYGDTLVKAFQYGDTIKTTEIWSNNILVIKRHSWMLDYGSCTSVASPLPSYYIGIIILANADTLFAWIRIQSIYIDTWETHFKIQEYACNIGSVGMSDYGKADFLKVFPNPCKDRIFIEFESQPVKPAFAILTDIKGQELLSQSVEDKCSQFDISKLSAGLYFLKVIMGKNLSVRKILVQ